MKALVWALLFGLASCDGSKPMPSPTAKTRCAETFASLFADLPQEVEVLPTEHYFYWKRNVEGKPLHGNLRFANGLREQGILSFGYAGDGISDSQYFTATEGVTLTCPDDFTVHVAFNGKTVRFHLHQLPQTPPTFPLLAEERFVERTHDESGLQFYLIYQTTGNFFLWMLDPTTPGEPKELGPDAWIDKTTGFVFWHDQGRHILVGVAAASIRANDYFDGPFDQLADNYALASGRQALLEKAVPECAGRIDAWGNYRDTPKPRRVALVPYCQYESTVEALEFLKAALATDHRYEYISHVARASRP